ncbi:hypothetical protein [Terriglobus aquaticus]|uniref:PEP-CTERM protein-sorting domain-containing protein n=1 Tax=Terriglobus aquaticus TaxID=940139 RepID=A0ABW9KL20_9BACT|nr:hypothetical protein [Terriglobus aquaticus]
MFRGILLILVAVFCSTAARADSISFTLLAPDQAASVGQTVTYIANVSLDSTSSPYYLYALAVNLNAPDGSDVTQLFRQNQDGFYNNFPFELDPGTSITDVLFTLELPAGLPAGTFTGTAALQGGSDPSSSDIQVSDAFSLTVVSETAEPGSFLFACTGMLLLAAQYYRTRQI